MGVTGIIDKILLLLTWRMNPEAKKKRAHNKLTAELAIVESAREEARRIGDNTVYMEKENERNEILKKIGRLNTRK